MKLSCDFLRFRRSRLAASVGMNDIREAEGAVVVIITDENLLGAISDLRWRLDGILADRTAELLVDIGGVRCLSSSTVAILLLTNRRCRARGIRLVVRGASAASACLLRKSGLDEILEVGSSSNWFGRHADPARPASSGNPDADAGKCVSFLGGLRAPSAARAFARDWCICQGLPRRARDDVAYLISGAVTAASDSGARHLSVSLSMYGNDELVAQVSWKARRPQTDRAGFSPVTAAICDSIAIEWDLGSRGRMRFVRFRVDARGSDGEAMWGVRSQLLDDLGRLGLSTERRTDGGAEARSGAHR